jgi:hypothetical protein
MATTMLEAVTERIDALSSFRSARTQAYITDLFQVWLQFEGEAGRFAIDKPTLADADALAKYLCNAGVVRKYGRFGARRVVQVASPAEIAEACVAWTVVRALSPEVPW